MQSTRQCVASPLLRDNPLQICYRLSISVNSFRAVPQHPSLVPWISPWACPCSPGLKSESELLTGAPNAIVKT
jgi:hypothetical protein